MNPAALHPMMVVQIHDSLPPMDSLPILLRYLGAGNINTDRISEMLLRSTMYQNSWTHFPDRMIAFQLPQGILDEPHQRELASYADIILILTRLEFDDSYADVVILGDVVVGKTEHIFLAVMHRNGEFRSLEWTHPVHFRVQQAVRSILKNNMHHWRTQS